MSNKLVSNKLVGAHLVCVAIVYYCCLSTPLDCRAKPFVFCGAKKRAARSNAAKGSFDRRQGLKNPQARWSGLLDISVVG